MRKRFAARLNLDDAQLVVYHLRSQAQASRDLVASIGPNDSVSPIFTRDAETFDRFADDLNAAIDLAKYGRR